MKGKDTEMECDGMVAEGERVSDLTGLVVGDLTELGLDTQVLAIGGSPKGMQRTAPKASHSSVLDVGGIGGDAGEASGPSAATAAVADLSLGQVQREVTRLLDGDLPGPEERSYLAQLMQREEELQRKGQVEGKGEDTL